MSEFEKALDKVTSDVEHESFDHPYDIHFEAGAQWARTYIMELDNLAIKALQKENEWLTKENEWLTNVGAVRKENTKLRADLALAVEALENCKAEANFQRCSIPVRATVDAALSKIKTKEGE